MVQIQILDNFCDLVQVRNNCTVLIFCFYLNCLQFDLVAQFNLDCPGTLEKWLIMLPISFFLG